MVANLERNAARAKVVLRRREVLRVDSERHVTEPRGALVRAGAEESQAAAVRHQRDRGVAPLGRELPLEPQDVAVPGLGCGLVADAQRYVIEALHVESHVATLRPRTTVTGTAAAAILDLEGK